MNTHRKDVLELIAEETRPRQVEKTEATFNATMQPKRSDGREMQEPIDRFLSYVRKGKGPDDCWLYTGGARFHIGGRGGKEATSPAVFAWVFIHGQKPTRRIFKQCGNGHCIRHLGLKRPPCLGDSRLIMHTVSPEQARKRTGNVIQMPMAAPPATETRSVVSVAQTLSATIELLDLLSEKDRCRVLGAIQTFYGRDGI